MPQPEHATGPAPSANPITTWNEKPLHAGLKAWCAQPGDRFEVPLDGCCVDVVRGHGDDALLIEVQTAGLGAIRRKLVRLADSHRVRLIMPVTEQKWILRREDDAERRRKSPKRGRLLDLFGELVRAPTLLAQAGFSLTVVLTHEEEVRARVDGVRAWRRKGWSVVERRLLRVTDSRTFETAGDLAALLPGGLPAPFHTGDLAEAWDAPRWLAQKAAYCYRALGVLDTAGKRGNAVLYVPARAAGAASSWSSTSRTT